jgi:ubiquinone/menaquinone biosynthesis C-methylase UbiE
VEEPGGVISNLDRYQRIAPFYDLLDLPFERRRYRALRPLLFRGLSGRLLDAGVGTGRNFPFYSTCVSAVVGIDLSPRMLALAERRRDLSPVPIELRQMDVTNLDFANNTFDTAVSTFLFCVLPDQLQVPALPELGRVVKRGGPIRRLEYVRPRGTLRRIVSRIWEPWIAFAYGASFDRQTESHIPAAGLEVAESRYVVDDLVKLICARAARRDQTESLPGSASLNVI